MEELYLYIAGVLVAGLFVGHYFKLLPWQWKCMYDDDVFVERCDHQCRFCRENEDKV